MQLILDEAWLPLSKNESMDTEKVIINNVYLCLFVPFTFHAIKAYPPLPPFFLLSLPPSSLSSIRSPVITLVTFSV